MYFVQSNNGQQGVHVPNTRSQLRFHKKSSIVEQAKTVRHISKDDSEKLSKRKANKTYSFTKSAVAKRKSRSCPKNLRAEYDRNNVRRRTIQKQLSKIEREELGKQRRESRKAAKDMQNIPRLNSTVMYASDSECVGDYFVLEQK